MIRRNTNMKLLYIWSYAVIVFFSASNGQNTSSDHSRTSAPPVILKSEFTTTSLNQNVSTSVYTTPGGKSENDTTLNNSEKVFENNETTRNNETIYGFTEEPNNNDTTGLNSTVIDTEAAEDESGNTSPTTEKNDGRSTTVAVTESKAASSWGYVLLILILFLILALCIILFYMRRVSRTYTFDLQRPAPGRVEPIGSFEPVYLDDLDYQVHTAGISKAAEGNGTVLSTEDKELNGEVSQNSGQQTPESGPTAETEPNPVQPDQDQPDQDQVDQDQLDQDLSSSPVLFIDESQEEMNENNNNQSVRSSAFVEINLEEPQSSVQPFNFSASELQHFY